MTEPTKQAAQAAPSKSAPRAVAVLLTNGERQLLLQLRDAAASIGPNLWCTIGGAIEPGETPARAAVRELAEEAGLHEQDLALWWHGDLPKNLGTGLTRWWVYTGTTDATTDDVVIGEGADIRFIPRGQVLDRQLVPSAHTLLSRWIKERETES